MLGDISRAEHITDIFILFSMLSLYLKCVLIGICVESRDLFLLTNAN
jgi:hypothetical protein